MKKLISAFLVILILTQFHCANVSSPSGGPDDETPPQLISSIPEQGQTNYTSQTVILTFDEWVTTQNIETDIIITPRITGSFKTRVKKNIIELTFFEPLQQNTTYAVAFGQTVEDVTNDNSAQNLNLSFSTGDFIDSLTISGNIKTLLDQEAAEGALVALYKSSDTTNILNGIASYFTITDSLGNYKFNNLPHDSYRIYSANDKNQNNKGDSKSEKYGFYPDTLHLNSSIENINFTIQQLNTTELRRLSARHFGNYYDITFNKAIDNFEILTQREYYYQRLGLDKIRFYRYNQTFNDTLQVIYQATDSLNYTLKDTVGLYFTESKLDASTFTVSPEPEQPTIAPESILKFKFSKPILSYNIDSIFIRLDSTTVYPISDSLFQFNTFKTELETGINLSQLISKKYPRVTLSFNKGSFTSIENDTSEVLNKIYSLVEDSETAVISGQIITSSENVIVQLINANNRKVIREAFTKKYSFEYLPAGRYMIRVVDDSNGNQRLDIGNILTNEVPENVHYYFDNYYQSKVIEVRKNWESTANISF